MQFFNSVLIWSLVHYFRPTLVSSEIGGIDGVCMLLNEAPTKICLSAAYYIFVGVCSIFEKTASVVSMGFFSLLLRFTDDNFDPDQAATIGVDFKVTTLTVNGNSAKLAIWVSHSVSNYNWNITVTDFSFNWNWTIFLLTATIKYISTDWIESQKLESDFVKTSANEIVY